MECRLLGWPADGPRLDLDHERFAYAGNFRTGRTGIAVALEPEPGPPGDAQAGVGTVDGRPVVAAASFDADRAVPDALRIRYLVVREDRRGEGIGGRLAAYVVERALDRRYDRVRIGVNNPIAYHACYRAGFGFTGEESGMGELVLEAPAPVGGAPERYRDGLERFADRDLPEHQRTVLERHVDGSPPGTVDPPESDRDGTDGGGD